MNVKAFLGLKTDGRKKMFLNGSCVTVETWILRLGYPPSWQNGTRWNQIQVLPPMPKETPSKGTQMDKLAIHHSIQIDRPSPTH